MTPDEMRVRVATARVGRLATAAADGRPHLVPFCFVLEGPALYSAVDWKRKGRAPLRRLENIRAQPRVSVLVDHYEEDWEKLWWVRLDGQAEVLEAGAEADRALVLLAGKYEQYRERPPAGPVIKVQVEQWVSWAAG